MTGSSNCIRSIRVEDATLAELTDMLLTIFPHGIPHNSIILLGTATSLLHQGSSGYILLA